MTVPDDVTLLWTDDTYVITHFDMCLAPGNLAKAISWGNVRRYPVPSERNRTGGAGVYYHVSPDIVLSFHSI